MIQLDSYRDLAQLMLIAYDGISGRRVYQCQKYLEQTEKMTREQLRSLQLKRLKALLKHAYENVPFYRRTFKTVNFHPNDLRSLDDIRRIPILRKKMVRDELNEMVARNFSKRKLVCRKTSGTTAVPTKFYRDKLDVSWGIAAELRGYGWAGCQVGDKTGMIGGFSTELKNNIRFIVENWINRNKYLWVADLSERTMESFARKMQRFSPEFIRGNSSQVNVFATFLLQNRRWEIRPKAVFTTGEALLPHYKRNIEEAFGCDTYDYYGSSEVSHVAMQCGQSEAHHVIEENILLEVVKDGEMIGKNEQGNVLLTNLHSYAMPFIRFELGDNGKVFGNDCSCGRQSMLFNPVGRKLEYFINSDGSFTFLRDFGLIFEDVPIEDFQVVQENYDDIVIKVIPRGGFSEKHVDFIQKNAKKGGPANVRVEVVNRKSLTKGAKVLHTVSKLPSKYT